MTNNLERKTTAMKQAILELIFGTPNIRTVEIADRLDMELDSVRPLVAAEIASGAIVEEPIIAPNGRTVLSFRFASAAPVAAAVAATLAPEPVPARIARTVPPPARKAAPAPAPAPVAAAEPVVAAGDALATQFVMGAPQPAAPEIDVVVTRKTDVPLAVELPAPVVTAKRASLSASLEPVAPRAKEKTKVDIGIEYLYAQDEPVPTEFLSRAMNLKKGHHPSSYMLAAIKLGRVVYDQASKTWSKGVEPQPVAEAAPVERAPLVVPKFIPGEGVEGAKLDTAAADWVAEAKPAEPVIESPAAAPLDAAAEWVKSAQPDPAVTRLHTPVAPPAEVKPVALPTGGLPNIRTPFLPRAPELDISRTGMYENGEFRRPVGDGTIKASDTPRFRITEPGNDAQFLAGVMSDGSLLLRVPGRAPFDLPCEHARTLYEFMQAHGYAAWTKKQAA